MYIAVVCSGLLLLIILVLIFPYLRYISTSYKQVSPSPKVIIMAHRGASLRAPENTLASFRKALDLRAKYLELDVHLSKDDAVVVIHDAKVDRTSNGKGYVANHTCEELKKLDVGSWYDASFRGETIPLLQEVIALTGNDINLVIELKTKDGQLYPTLVPRLLTIINDCGIKNRVLLQSFHREYLQEILKMDPEIKCCQLYVGSYTVPPMYIDSKVHVGYFHETEGVYAVNLFYAFINPGLVAYYHNKGIKVYCYTLDDKIKALKAIAMGIDGIVTNDPLLLSGAQ